MTGIFVAIGIWILSVILLVSVPVAIMSFFYFIGKIVEKYKLK